MTSTAYQQDTLAENLRLGFAGADMVSMMEFRENSGFGENKAARILKEGIEKGTVLKKRFVVKTGALTKYLFNRQKCGKSVHKCSAEGGRNSGIGGGEGDEVCKRKFFEKLPETPPLIIHHVAPPSIYLLENTDLSSSLREADGKKKEVGEKKEVGVFLDFAPLLGLFHGPKAESIKNSQEHPYFRRSLFYGTLVLLDPQNKTRDALNIVFKVLQNPDTDLLDKIPENCTYETAFALHNRFLGLYVCARQKIQLASEHEEAKLNLNITRVYDEQRTRDASNRVRNPLGLLKHFLADESVYTYPKSLVVAQNTEYLQHVEEEAAVLGMNVYGDGLADRNTHIDIADRHLVKKVEGRMRDARKRMQEQCERYAPKYSEKITPIRQGQYQETTNISAEGMLKVLDAFRGEAIDDDVFLRVTEHSVSFVTEKGNRHRLGSVDPALALFPIRDADFVENVRNHLVEYDKKGVLKKATCVQ
jgi:hypothetical protein